MSFHFYEPFILFSGNLKKFIVLKEIIVKMKRFGKELKTVKKEPSENFITEKSTITY